MVFLSDDDLWGEVRFSSTHSCPPPLVKEPRCPSNRRLCWPQNRSTQFIRLNYKILQYQLSVVCVSFRFFFFSCA